MKEILHGLGYYPGNDIEDGECNDDLVAAIVDFENSHVNSRYRTGGLIRNNKAHERALKKFAKSGYNKKEKSQNTSFKTEGDAATRGKHVYYRNATPGNDHMLRIKNGSCGRVEYSLKREEIAANLTPGT